MIARATALLSVGVLLTAAQTVLPGEPGRPAASWATNLIRPFALPPLWRDLTTATVEGRSADATAAAVRIAALIPSWDDGAALAAWLSAFDEASDAPSPGAAAERVLSAIALLEERAGFLAAQAPQRAADVLGTAATIAEAAFARLPDAAAALHDRQGSTPSEIAADLLGRAAALDPSEARAERRALATLRAACGAIRLGDLSRAELTFEAAVSQFRAVGTDFAQRSADALHALPPLSVLAADPSPLRAQAGQPLFLDLADALDALRAAKGDR
jgi:hypothetical protein